MSEEATEAIVLRTMEYGESDKLVRFATRDFGKISGIAKGAKRSKRRFSNALETFGHVRLRFKTSPAGSLAFVLGCDLIEPRTGISTELSRLALASFFTEIADATLREGQAIERAFTLLDGVLRWLDQKGQTSEILPFFELQWLEVSGLQPELHRCVNCKANGESFSSPLFSVERGGTVCRDCCREIESTLTGRNREEMLLPLQPGTRKSLQMLLKADLENFSRIQLSSEQLREAHRILKSFLRFHIGREFKSAPFLEQTLRLLVP